MGEYCTLHCDISTVVSNIAVFSRGGRAHEASALSRIRLYDFSDFINFKRSKRSAPIPDSFIHVTCMLYRNAERKNFF